jgi:hypothetical protein
VYGAALKNSALCHAFVTYNMCDFLFVSHGKITNKVDLRFFTSHCSIVGVYL